MTAEETEELPSPDGDGSLAPRRWSWLVLVGIAAGVVGNLGKVMVVACDELQTALAQHAVWADDRRDFADAVRLDLDTIPQVTPDGVTELAAAPDLPR